MQKRKQITKQEYKGKFRLLYTELLPDLSTDQIEMKLEDSWDRHLEHLAAERRSEEFIRSFPTDCPEIISEAYKRAANQRTPEELANLNTDLFPLVFLGEPLLVPIDVFVILRQYEDALSMTRER